MQRNHIVVVVLGDMGHSPRMVNHVKGLLAMGHRVTLVGYDETPHGVSHPQFSALPIAPFPASPDFDLDIFGPLGFFGPPMRTLFRIFFQFAMFPCKFLYLFIALVHVLFLRVEEANGILVQCPPAIPVFWAGYLAALFHSCALTIDWHNFGFSLLALRFENSHPIVSAYYWLERLQGGLADSHFCVSEAMQARLARWGISATVLRDRAPRSFQPNPPPEIRNRLFSENPNLWPFGNFDGFFDSEGNRPFLCMSSTSWTPDEDFSVLLTALDDLDTFTTRTFIVYITGKGPLLDFYQAEIRRRNYQHITIICCWLSYADYRTLLGVVDVGISLHASSSGVDLPMKVVDMHGAALPVLSIRFEAIDELVLDRRNGLLFDDAAELAQLLKEVSMDNPQILDDMREYLKTHRKYWETEWRNIAHPILYPPAATAQ